MPTEYIASGDYCIAVSEPKLLKALLGSCVGVAIYDKTANIGGIIHLLLPEPATLGSSWSPCSYATSGLPLFINTLLHFGAQAENLQAVITGGALFGGISQQDIALNIGGRCVEKVHEVLRERQIPIIKEESCGFTPYSLTLDTTSWQSEIVSRFDTPSTYQPPPPPNSQELAKAIAAITPIPQAALTVINLISTSNYETAEIARIIETDQVLAAQTLRLCNSPLFGIKRIIDSLDEAVIHLGSSHLLQMVATSAIASLQVTRPGGYAMLKGGLYKHALGVAHAARLIATETGLVNGDTAYTAGLLHDIGKVVLDQYFACFNPLFYREELPHSDFIDREHHSLGTNHQEVGHQLARDWNLPSSIAQAIGHHHHPEQASSHQALVHLIYLADLLTSWYLTGLEFEQINTAALSSRLRFLGITPPQLPALIEKIPWKKVMYL